MERTEYSGDIIDSHMHLWDRKNHYSWLDKPPFESRLKGNFLIENYLKLIKNQHFTKAVHVECHGFPGDPVLETKWIQEIGDKYGMPQGIVGYAPLNHPEIETILKRHREYPNMRGIRMNIRFASQGLFLADRGDYMSDKAWRHGFSLLSKYRLSFDMQIYPEQIHDAINLLKEYDDVPVIIDHLALPHNPSEKTFDVWMNNVKQLAEIPTAYMKLSGIGVYFQDMDHLDTMSKYISQAIEIFGVHRCLFASNCPPDGAFIPFDSLVGIYKKVTKNYSKEDQRLLFYQNAQQVYNL